MTSLINASTSAGVVITPDTSGVLALQTAGTTAVTVSASQVVSLTSGLAVTGPTTVLKNGGTGATAGLLLSGGGSSTNFNIDYGTVASNRLYFRQNYFDGSGHITFQYSSDGTMASPIDVLAIKYGGGIAVTGLTDISAATSGQIKFPATQNASSNANTLDDYEEGTWTPTITAYAGSITAYTSSGSYVKIGRVVFCTVYAVVSNAGTASNAYVISNLPFPLATPLEVYGYGIDLLTNTGLVAYGATSSSLYVLKYNGTFPGGSGTYIPFNFNYSI
jgi:hypothetical protein